jgi:hypothetical protein
MAARRANDSKAIESSVEYPTGGWQLAAGSRSKRTNAEIKIAQGRVEALQKDGQRQGEARTFRPAPYAEFQGQETQTPPGNGHAGKRRRPPQSKADDSVSVRAIDDCVIADY